MNTKTKSLSLSIALLAGLISTGASAANYWPDLPVGFKSGVSAQVGEKLFVGLGSAGSDFYMLDLNEKSKGWQKQASFSGPVPSGATATVLGDQIYVFGGSGKVSKDDKSPILFDTVYSYDVSANEWTQVETKTPKGLLGAASYSPDGEQILFFGGYNKGYFDQYLSDVLTTDKSKEPKKWQKIVDDYMGMKPLDYKWNRQVLSYSPQDNWWKVVGDSPYLPNCGAAIVTNESKVTLISGEIKPGLRTAEVKEFDFSNAQPWTSLHSLPASKDSQVQEGVAGAFAGEHNGVVIVAGGANFHGAKKAFEQGNMFAHNGFGKAFNPETFVLENGLWKQAKNLPEGLAYGASFTTKDGVLIVGGEDSNRKARSEVYLMAWDGTSLTVTN